MVPWLVLGVLLVWALGLGFVLMAIGLVWLPAAVSASRARRSALEPTPTISVAAA